jgi:hypothetical protein
VLLDYLRAPPGDEGWFAPVPAEHSAVRRALALGGGSEGS